MATSVYVSNEYISVLTGKMRHKKLNIERAEKRELPAGSIVNGVIIDDAKIVLAIKKLVDDGALGKKKINLVIDSGNILTKKLDVPIMNEKQIMQTVRHEFSAQTSVYQELLYDYMPLRPNGKAGGTILCVATERKLVESYIELFENSGVKINSVRISIATKIALYRFLPELSDKTLILAGIDGNTIVTTLFSGGLYIMSSRQRLYEERGSAAAMGEVVQAISSLIQFHKTQNATNPIEKIWMCGLNGKETSNLQILSDALDCDVEKLKSESVIDNADGKYDISQFCYATGNLLEQRG